MAIKITKVAEAIEDNGIKILIHAPAGTGKTVLAATACESTLIISAEAGLLSLSNDDMKDLNPHFMPELCDVAVISTIEELEELYEMLFNQAGESDWEWVAIDSISEIAEVILANELEEAKDPRKAYGELYNRVTKILRLFRDLPYYNIYMAAKQAPRVDDYSGLTIYQAMMPGKKLGDSIAYLFDEVLCLRVLQDEDGGDYRVLQTARDVQYEAKDRSGKLDKHEAPSLKRIADKIRGDYVEEDEEVEKKDEPKEVEESKEEEVDQKQINDDLAAKEATKLKRLEYYYHVESNVMTIARTKEDVAEFLEQGLDKVTKAKYNAWLKAEKAAELDKIDETFNKKEEIDLDTPAGMSAANEEETVDNAEMIEFAKALATLDHSDLASLALKLDDQIETDVAFEASDEELIGWVCEHDMDDIKEASKEIGLA